MNFNKSKKGTENSPKNILAKLPDDLHSGDLIVRLPHTHQILIASILNSWNSIVFENTIQTQYNAWTNNA